MSQMLSLWFKETYPVFEARASETVGALMIGAVVDQKESILLAEEFEGFATELLACEAQGEENSSTEV
ncbi:hypothetical protein CLAFUW4_10428 [Fulvia fulva]|uniref:Uncharacterized protein n=1 Tax=Passalora fulva TaxID=5499 RepID=A0A9Q8LDZ3_PASFU|nr:uncharacterized protein CLAFUR5_05043 [Fulvia fulva]KAK4616076.1 hypothetical protein CLAFUR4_10432 [Fulvia fulva]KAK4617347.1 hypothetical protein CLAFUR0_10433 [Fulvia fulva]UJO15786.1 hypothetical protein CLAFUR5_05043 [Fulvia fulva]WPV18988.1 hypothetical protein CLAFUW4_10428 [Fulvia fulva]WPV34234.1 hypothetical protein CLAFUW7_10428 [Fulvia fulva]